MLYVASKEDGSAIGDGYYTRPCLATDYPVYSEDKLTANVTLKDDVYWHNFTDIYTDPLNPVEYNNELFTADDVIYTFEALMSDDSGAWGRADFIDVLDTSIHPGGVERINDYKVRFHLLAPYVELPELLGDDWGCMILPEHILGDVPFGDLYGHWTNKEFPPPGLGPFRFVEDNVAEGYWTIEAVENYAESMGGEHVIDEVICYLITDMAAGWTALMNHEIHFGYDVWDATPEQIAVAAADPSFNVYDSPIPLTRHLMFNSNHPVLSNRYVRQAIAHAINYPHIANDILPLVGISGHLQATPVWPSLEWAYPTPADEVAYNIGPYPYDIDIAQQYMDMYLYSLSENAPAGSPEVELGPVGDADFSGFVELDDFAVWAENIGTSPDAWPWYSDQDIDPDADNTDYVELADFYDWRENIGEYYPFYGAR
jgi:ABC-type transport system substrate-binding protein